MSPWPKGKKAPTDPASNGNSSGNGNGGTNGKRAPKRLPVFLTPEEADALRATLNTRSTTGLRNRAMLETMLGAGLRVSELCALKGVDVDLQRGTLTVRQGKGSKDRTVPVGHETLGWLQAWAEKRRALGLNGRQAFFAGVRTGRTGATAEREQGEGLKPRYVQGLVATLARAAEIEKRVSPHTLRHTYATAMLRRGFTIKDVQVLLGHANIQTTEIYLHSDQEDLRRKIQGEEQQPEPTIDPQVQAAAQVLANLTNEQRQALVAILGTEAKG